MGDFKSQPFDQLASVLRAMGHGETARRIGALKERTRVEMLAVSPWPLRMLMRAYGLLAGYGHRIELTLGWALGAVLLGALVFQLAWSVGGMEPLGARQIDATVWSACLETAQPAACWLASPPGREHEGFEPLLYSLDVLVPVIDLGQAGAWRPARERGARFRELFTERPDRAELRETRERLPIVGEWVYKIASTRLGDLAWGWRHIQAALGYVLTLCAATSAATALRRT